MNQRSVRTAMMTMAIALGSATTVGAATTANLPPEQKQGSIVFLSGGVGKDQQAAIKHVAAGYPLELEFLKGPKAPREYLSGVHVDIKDTTGKPVLNTQSDGPFLLVKVPHGTYSISATDGGRTQTRNVTVTDGEHQRVVFAWR
jgi:hypothetical protein